MVIGDTPKLPPDLGRDGARSSVFVEFTGEGAVDAAASAPGKSQGAATSAAQRRRHEVADTAATVVDTAQSEDARATELFQVANAVPGVALSANSDALRAVASRPDVVKISRLVPKKPMNAGAAQLTRALEAWQGGRHTPGVTGEGVTVGVIDTGIDYTHADFGGPGTRAAYQQAVANEADPDWPESLPEVGKAKVVGGHDFVGNHYDATPTNDDGSPNAGYDPKPQPDENPIDCAEHGTHVSGTVAGYGVTKRGKTFAGDYARLSSDKLYDMRVAPGMAPKAQLYALKVFGCTGSTDAVIPALDWALDPNRDGDFDDHLDIVNLSLGSDFGAVDDPENAVIDKLAENGVLPVVAIGNIGDLTDAGGSPGNAVRSLAVASSLDAYQLRDGLQVNAPKRQAGIAAGQMSTEYDWATQKPVTGDVVALSGTNADGCDALAPAEAAEVKDKVVWLEWDDSDASRRCGSGARSDNVTAAGAIGAILTSGVDVFTAGILGNEAIPVFQLSKAQTDRLRPSVGNTLNVTFDGSLHATVKDLTPSIADTLSTFSSRGTHGSLGVVKPDVTAPGDTIASAQMGSGDDVLVSSGTSMATPVTAGIAALVRSVQRAWSPEQVKADIMNTAGHDLTTGPNGSGNRYGPARVGAGRVDARAAVQNTILAYSAETPGAVSASFGVVEAPAWQPLLTRTRSLTVQNTGRSSARLALSYDPVVGQPGVSYSVSPSSLTLSAGGTATATVTMTVRPGQLRHTLDPTMERDQLGVPRQFVADASGLVTLTPKGAAALRVPVYGAAKPVSTTTTRKLPGKDLLVNLGVGVNQGSGPDSYHSLLSVMQLGATSPRLPDCSGTVTKDCAFNATARGGDLQYVGAGSTPGALWFGIATYGNWATLGSATIPYIDIDTRGNKNWDYRVFVQNYPDADVLLATLIDYNSGELVGQAPVNFNFGDVDTNVFDTNVMLLPVDPAAIGVGRGHKRFPITYRVGMFSNHGMFENGDVDSVEASYDVGQPAISTRDPLYLDRGGVVIRYQSWAKKSDRAKALVVHLHGASGHRAEVVPLTP